MENKESENQKRNIGMMELICLMRAYGIQSGYRLSQAEHLEKLVKKGNQQALKVKEIIEKKYKL